jgi:hypothetical protein
MGVLTGLFILAICGIVADTIVKVAKSRGGAATAKALRGELDEMAQQLLDQSAVLADAQATIASQAESIQELHERVDFAERILTQVREKGALGRGSGEAGKQGSELGR